MERPVSSPDLKHSEHLWDKLGRAVRARVTNTTTLVALQQMLDEEWDTISQQCESSMGRRCQAVVAVYCSREALVCYTNIFKLLHCQYVLFLQISIIKSTK